MFPMQLCPVQSKVKSKFQLMRDSPNMCKRAGHFLAKIIKKNKQRETVYYVYIKALNVEHPTE